MPPPRVSRPASIPARPNRSAICVAAQSGTRILARSIHARRRFARSPLPLRFTKRVRGKGIVGFIILLAPHPQNAAHAVSVSKVASPRRIAKRVRGNTSFGFIFAIAPNNAASPLSVSKWRSPRRFKNPGRRHPSPLHPFDGLVHQEEDLLSPLNPQIPQEHFRGQQHAMSMTPQVRKIRMAFFYQRFGFVIPCPVDGMILLDDSFTENERDCSTPRAITELFPFRGR